MIINIVPDARLTACLVLLSALLLTKSPAWSQVPANAPNAGMINQHFNQQMFWERNAPYMFEPVNPNKLSPNDSDEPVIEYHDMDVQGTIVPSIPSTPPQGVRVVK